MRSKFTLRRTRTVQAALAAAMLAVPASALAITTTTAADRSSPASTTVPLPVRVTPRHVSLGDAIEVAGQASGSGAGGRVMLEARYGRHSAWTRLSSATIDRTGSFSFHAHPRHSGLLRAVPLTAATSSPDTAPGGLTQRVTLVKVAAELHAPGRDHDVLAGGAVTIAGHLLPGGAGRTVALQGRTGQGWRTLAQARTGRRGGFTAHYAPQSTSLARRLRVLFRGDGDNARAVRPAGAMTVYHESVASWYEDGGGTACGFHAGLGVANKSLPCGAKVRFRHHGHTVTATVDDRGPYVGGRDFDLNQNTAAALGFDGVGTVWSTS